MKNKSFWSLKLLKLLGFPVHIFVINAASSCCKSENSFVKLYVIFFIVFIVLLYSGICLEAHDFKWLQVLCIRIATFNEKQKFLKLKIIEIIGVPCTYFCN